MPSNRIGSINAESAKGDDILAAGKLAGGGDATNVWPNLDARMLKSSRSTKPV